MTEWRDIESAPRDGSYVLLWHDGIGAAVTCSWRKSLVHDGRERWRPYYSGIDDREYLLPKLWQPLPNPPEHVNT